ncbi:MAG TPA: hypothetical protein VHW00_14960 [Thermoanaerobaculia bacterium]|nr:hypothetical protein [Thermoanaerobaculia bacterium]
MHNKRIPVLLAVLLLTFPTFAETFATGGPHTTNNDDSCDIALLPAATLLLPYFEVDTRPGGETTLFTITNVTNQPQVARVTLWTDRGYMVVNFNIFLTGYDTQSINLFDIIARGIIAPDLGTGEAVSERGDFSEAGNPLVDLSACDELPGVIPNVYVQRLQKTLKEGLAPAFGNIPGCAGVGGQHENAVGYATIDVVRKCGVLAPDSPQYYEQDILWENVLTGDFQQVHSGNNYAQGNPLVHIRAVPEGGSIQQRLADPASYTVNFERTFYGRYQSGETLDGRQPLPARFAARWISGGTGSFKTSYKIWREGRTDGATPCDQWEVRGGKLPITEITAFDEEENPFTVAEPICCINTRKELPSASLSSVANDDLYPPIPNGAVAGWMYLNLDNLENDDIASQNWVVTSMRAEERFSTDIDATALGNGCSPEVAQSEVYEGNDPIGPSPNGN